jgi:hypothetical protein
MGIYWPVSVASFEVLSLSIHDSLLFFLLEMSNPPLSLSLAGRLSSKLGGVAKAICDILCLLAVEPSK